MFRILFKLLRKSIFFLLDEDNVAGAAEENGNGNEVDVANDG